MLKIRLYVAQIFGIKLITRNEKAVSLIRFTAHPSNAGDVQPTKSKDIVPMFVCTILLLSCYYV